MAKINISFNNTNYSIDEASLSSASAALQSHLSTVMNGTGATINFGGTAYNIDSTKLSAATNDFVTHLGTVSGDGYKVVVNGTEHNVASAKMTTAVSDLEVVLGGLISNDEATIGCDTLTWDGNTDGLVTDTSEGIYYKVSDVVLTMDDCAGGISITMVISGDTVTDTYYYYNDDGMVDFGDGAAIYAPNDNYNYADEYYFPERGLYFILVDSDDFSSMVQSLTINGYTGFPHSENC